MTISLSTGLPDIISVQKKVYPLIFTAIVSEQPTSKPVATAYGLKKIDATDDGSGWKNIDFRLDRWYAEVKSTKLKTEVSVEVIQDMKAIGVGEDFITENLADEVATEINTQIITNLKAISTLGGGLAVAGTLSEFDKGREVYALAHAELAKLEKTTGCIGSFIVASGKAFEVLLGSSLITEIKGTKTYRCESGATVVHDTITQADEIVVGVKRMVGDIELASLVWSPYDFEGHDESVLAYQHQTVNSASMTPVYGLIARHAFTTAPLLDQTGQTGVVELDWDNLDANVANSSALSITHAVTFA